MIDQADVMIIGDRVLGLSIAFALADRPESPSVMVIGKQGAGASDAAGAMLGVLGEITGTSLRTTSSTAKSEMALDAARRWPAWRSRVHGRAATGDDGYGTGTFLLLNGASSRLDDESFAAIEAFGAANNVPIEDVAPAEIPGYLPFDGDRASRALLLPDEGYIDARRWLQSLRAALAAMSNVTVVQTDHPRPVATDDRFVVETGAGRVTAGQVVVAAGVWTPHVAAGLRPGTAIVPVVSGAGSAMRLRTDVPVSSVLRTPNRSFACGLHLVPQADGSVYLGATNNVALVPGDAPTLSNLHYLSESMVRQFHEGLATAEVHETYFGNRPIGIDSYPLLGETSVHGCWVATGMYREGLHASPLLADAISSGVMGGPVGLPDQFAPERDPLVEWRLEDAIAEASRHCHALTVEVGMRPPVMGRWGGWLRDMYSQMIDHTYASMPDGFVLDPELAPLAYETGPDLLKVVTDYLATREDRAGT